MMFFISWESGRIDCFIRQFYEKKGWFTPSYETRKSPEARRKVLYEETFADSVKLLCVIPASVRICNEMGTSGYLPVKQLAESKWFPV